MFTATMLAMLAQSFQYHAEIDAMSDEILHVARIGDESPSLAIMCGAETDAKMFVDLDPGMNLNDRKGGRLARFTNRVRFGDGPVQDVDVRYYDDRVLIAGRAAAEFARAAKESSRVTFEIFDSRDIPQHVQIRLIGASESIGRVERECENLSR